MKHDCDRREFMAFAGGFAALSIAGTPGDLQAEVPQPFRRVVTGVNPSGESTILSDGQVNDVACSSMPGQASGCGMWMENAVPVNLLDQSDPMDSDVLSPLPPPGGVLVGAVTYEPGFSYPMHQTETLDFLFVISGQLELILEDGSTVLSSGDTLVQRGTNHAWRVVGDEPCTFISVLLSADA